MTRGLTSSPGVGEWELILQLQLTRLSKFGFVSATRAAARSHAFKIDDQGRAILEVLSSSSARLRTSDPQASARLRRRQLRASRSELLYPDCLFATRAIIGSASLILRFGARSQTGDPSSSAIYQLCLPPNPVADRAPAEPASQYCDPERSRSRQSSGFRCGSARAGFVSFQFRIRPTTPCHAGTIPQTF